MEKAQQLEIKTLKEQLATLETQTHNSERARQDTVKELHASRKQANSEYEQKLSLEKQLKAEQQDHNKENL